MFTVYTYRVQVVSEAQPINVEMEITLFGRVNHRRYTMPIDLLTSSSFLMTHRMTDGFQGPFRKAEIKYRDLPSIAFGSPIRFAVYSLNITYLSHLDAYVREKYSSVLCTDFLVAASNHTLRNESTFMVTLSFNVRQCALNTQAINAYVDYATKLSANNTELQADLRKGVLYNCRAKTLIDLIANKSFG